jgi:hypothetical protein
MFSVSSYINYVFFTAVVTLLETNRDTGEEGVRTVAFLRKGNSFGVSTVKLKLLIIWKSKKEDKNVINNM